MQRNLHSQQCVRLSLHFAGSYFLEEGASGIGCVVSVLPTWMSNDWKGLSLTSCELSQLQSVPVPTVSALMLSSPALYAHTLLLEFLAIFVLVHFSQYNWNEYSKFKKKSSEVISLLKFFLYWWVCYQQNEVVQLIALFRVAAAYSVLSLSLFLFTCAISTMSSTFMPLINLDQCHFCWSISS